MRMKRVLAECNFVFGWNSGGRGVAHLIGSYATWPPDGGRSYKTRSTIIVCLATYSHLNIVQGWRKDSWSLYNKDDRKIQELSGRTISRWAIWKILRRLEKILPAAYEPRRRRLYIKICVRLLALCTLSLFSLFNWRAILLHLFRRNKKIDLALVQLYSENVTFRAVIFAINQERRSSTTF